MNNGIFGNSGLGNPNVDDMEVFIYDKAGTYTWRMPSWAKWVRVICIGGGSGGASGRKGAAGTARYGGGAGSGGSVTCFEFAPNALQQTATISVGAGGAGGAAVTANSTNGTGGAQSGTTTFRQTDWNRPVNAQSSPASQGGTTTGSPGTSTSSYRTYVLPSVASDASAAAAGQLATTPLGAPITGAGGAGGGWRSTTFLRQQAGAGNGFYMPNPFQRYNPFITGGNGGEGSDVAGVSNNGADGIGWGAGGGGGGAGTDNVCDSGAGGRGADGAVIITCYGKILPVNLQVFRTDGTWYKPQDPTLKVARVFLVGGGGGGGSGARQAFAVNKTGGGGGGGGGVTIVEIPLQYLPNTVDVTVGIGGTGGTAITTDDTTGNRGNDGTSTKFGGFAMASAGGGGSGGTTSTSASGGSGGGGTMMFLNFSTEYGNSGSNGSPSQSNGRNHWTMGGMGGCGIPASGTGTSTASGTVFGPNSWGGTNPTVGVNGSTLDPFDMNVVDGFFIGHLGGWGRSDTAPRTGGSGSRGAGGSGGGASLNGTESGAGGDGGSGYACIVCL